MSSDTPYVDTHCNVPNILRQLEYINHEANLKDQFKEFSRNYLPPSFGGCISVASDTASRQATISLLQISNIYGVFGIHPLYGDVCEQEILDTMKHPKTVAYGEIGLGVEYAKPELQKKIFIQQMTHAINLKKPIVIHTREAEDDTFNMMKQYIPKDWKLHVHCFTDTLPFAKKLLCEWNNLYFGFTGVITFKNSKDLQHVAKELPLDRLLLETDGPFMAPIPYRGQTCHPGHIPFIAHKLAELKSVSVDHIYNEARKNTSAMYGI